MSFVFLEGRLPVCRSEVEDSGSGPARQQDEEIAQIGPRLDIAEGAASEEGDKSGVGLGAVVRAQEEPIFATDHLPTQREFARVVVQRQSTIRQKTAQRLALIARIVDRLRNRRLVEHHVAFRVAPGEELLDDGSGLAISRLLFLLSGRSRDGPFDLEKRCDEGQCGLRPLGI